jgi:heat-inducible transcriptional repressor
MSEPEFSGSQDARRALRLLEERTLLQDLLARTVLNTSPTAQNLADGSPVNPAQRLNSVQVLIGGEGTWDELRNFSVVLTRYGSPGLATGTLGVLGPMRLPYGRTISTMRFLSSLLSDMVAETLVEEIHTDSEANSGEEKA